ncbi:hypothetical protein AB0F46_18450 [Streptomyces sp. NPDC026665]|uniref:hypothetical protein n=1 Tax=unclassified Streptomyces TaxID=2593676 RepID=UPI0033FFB0B1
MAITSRAKPSPTPSRRSNIGLAIVVAAVVAVGLALVLLNAQQQERLATVRQTQVSGQKTATGQRTDQTQLTCVLWALLREENSRKLTPDVQKAADRICAGVPTPAPSG